MLASHHPKQSFVQVAIAKIEHLTPGIALCIVVTLIAHGLERLERAAFGNAWLEALVLAILVGTAIRTAWMPNHLWTEGIAFSAKTLLEIAVCLLGASISAQTLLAVSPVLLIGIAVVVALAVLASFSIGRLLGLPRRMAMLVACGNSICGNSAIAAVAPVIGANGSDVAASIAFTAVLGVIVVVSLPFLSAALHLHVLQYGVFAGMTVYAVPQVLAATAPAGAVAMQIGTLVKLVRVLMLGPMVVTLSLLSAKLAEPGERKAQTPGKRPPLSRMVPWFIAGFLVLAGIRSAGLIPREALPPATLVSNLLTVISMAALGLGTDLKVVARSGARVTITVTVSLLLIGGISLGLIHIAGVH